MKKIPSSVSERMGIARIKPFIKYLQSFRSTVATAVAIWRVCADRTSEDGKLNHKDYTLAKNTVRMCCRGYRDPVGHTGLGAEDPAVPWPERMPGEMGLGLQRNIKLFLGCLERSGEKMPL